MYCLAMGVIFSAWTSWIFKAKSEDINRNVNLRNQARCVSNYVKSIIENAITVGWEIGVNNKDQKKHKDISILFNNFSRFDWSLNFFLQ